MVPGCFLHLSRQTTRLQHRGNGLSEVDWRRNAGRRQQGNPTTSMALPELPLQATDFRPPPKRGGAASQASCSTSKSPPQACRICGVYLAPAKTGVAWWALQTDRRFGFARFPSRRARREYAPGRRATRQDEASLSSSSAACQLVGSRLRSGTG